MTDVDQKLEATLVWDQAGHLAEPALHALADGELGLLPDQAVSHSAECRLCEERLGAIALLAVEIGEALVKHRREIQAWSPERVPAPDAGLAPARRPLPVAAFVAALAIAVAGTVTQLGGLAARVTHLPALIAHALPVLVHGIRLAIGGAGFAVAPWVAAALLVLGGVMIARLAPVRLSVKGPA